MSRQPVEYIRKVTLVRGRVAKWEPAPTDVTEPDGVTYFSSRDKIFGTMERAGGLLDCGARQWELSGGNVTHNLDPLTPEQRQREERKRFSQEYPPDVHREIVDDVEEARLDGAGESDERVQRFRAMRQRMREIKAEVDAL